MQMTPIKALESNYIWIMSEESNEVVVVDPGESAAVLDYLKKHHLSVGTILLTHKHHDHTEGVSSILDVYPECHVIGPVETKELNTKTVSEGDTITLFGKTTTVLLSAGHTKEHISFLVEDILLCGDSLFSAGCGRVFTGDYQAQFDTLQQFRQLPDHIRIYAGHEYTKDNLAFAQTLEDYPEAVDTELKRVKSLRQEGIPTLPSTIGKEKQINVFLQSDQLDTFKQLRDKRDDF